MRRALLAVGILFSSSAYAGIADSPIPQLDPAVNPKKTLHMYSIPGVLNDGGSNLGTFFSCTSTSTATQIVGVEVFPAAGGDPLNNAQTTKITVAPGQTVTFGTTSALSLFTDTGLGIGAMKGSARVLSTSKLLICSAFVADAVNPTPSSMTNLTVVFKTKQKGQ